ncbi:MAG: serine/threonine protein kinase, partial [Planctomycetes bacterium]|nr:serine/threonine protein kinase [Planctomycetota bacterium]
MNQIGPYKILDKLGEGGMGTVFLAEQERPVRRRVAVKVIRPGLDSDSVLARFESEQQALALMDHPHIARVLDAGATEDGRPYFVMEYVKGEPITGFCNRVRMPMRQRAELMIRVCDAIQHAHQRAIVHRDIKPSNVLVSQSDAGPEPKVIDFGVAKAMAQPLTERTLLTEFGQLLGTPDYMSPEQADTSVDRVDTRTDVYSLGVLFYELLVGSLPFDNRTSGGTDLFERLRQVREDDPQRPSTRVSTQRGESTAAAQQRRTTPERLRSELRGDLDWIVMRALEKDPARRYGSPAELARDIERHLRNEPVLAGPPSPWYRARKFVRRHRVGVAFAGVVVALLVALAVTMAVQADRVRVERDIARTAARRAAREAKTARRVSEFLTQVFDGADPELTGGKDVTARQLLDQGAQRIDALPDEPAVQATLRGVIGGVYLMLGAFDKAAPLIEPALQYLRAHPDEDRRAFARVLHL